jgi:hypothetical protein
MPFTITGLRLAVAIIEFIGSTSSFLGATSIIVVYLLLPMNKHFRHTLILNLAVSGNIFVTLITSKGSLSPATRRCEWLV